MTANINTRTQVSTWGLQDPSLNKWAIDSLEHISHFDTEILKVCPDDKSKHYTLKGLFDSTKGNLAQMSDSICNHKNRKIGIVTGFYISKPQKAETDGPLAAAQLALFFKMADIPCKIFTDKHCADVCLTALKNAYYHSKRNELLTACNEEMFEVVTTDTIEEMMALKSKIHQEEYSHLISIERPSPSFVSEVPVDMRGNPITKCAPFHILFDRSYEVESDHLPILYAALDRGNEIGGAEFKTSVLRETIPKGGSIAGKTGCDLVIASRTSNRAGAALLAALAAGGNKREWIKYGKRCLSPEVTMRIMNAMWYETYAVDGVTFAKEPEYPSVDGIPMTEHMKYTTSMIKILSTYESAYSAADYMAAENLVPTNDGPEYVLKPRKRPTSATTIQAPQLSQRGLEGRHPA